MVTNELKDRGKISELADRTIEITQFEQQREKRKEKERRRNEKSAKAESKLVLLPSGVQLEADQHARL